MDRYEHDTDGYTNFSFIFLLYRACERAELSQFDIFAASAVSSPGTRSDHQLQQSTTALECGVCARLFSSLAVPFSLACRRAAMPSLGPTVQTRRVQVQPIGRESEHRSSDSDDRRQPADGQMQSYHAAAAAAAPSPPVARRRRRGASSSLARWFVLLILVCLVPFTTCTAARLTRATVRTHVMALDDSVTNDTGSGGHATLAKQHPQRREPLTAAKIAVLSLQFDAPLAVTRQGNNGSEPSTLPLGQATPSDLFGLVRLICGHSLFDSHPPRDGSFTPEAAVGPHLLPGFLLLAPGEAGLNVNGSWAESWPLLALLENELETLDGPTSLRGFLVLGSSSGARGQWRSRITTSLDQCEVRILEESSQSWLPTGSLHLEDDEEATPIISRRKVELLKKPVETDAAASRLPAKTPLSTGVVRNLLRSISTSRAKSAALAGSASKPMFLETSVGASAKTEVKFAGILKGIISGLLAGLAKPMGDMIGSFTAEGILDPVAEKVLDGVTDSMQSGLSAYVQSDVVVQIIPGICEAVTAALTENTARAMAEAVTRGTTETVTTDVTTRVTHTIVDPVTMRSAQVIAVKTARMLHNSLTHILSRSIPHIIVPALLNTVSVGVKEDYYCYFCKEKQMYCIYCNKNKGDTMNRLYYALYYTSYHSTYYSNWYASQSKFGILMMKKRQLNPLDEVDDENEKAWDIKGRTPEDGTQKDPAAPATVVGPEGAPLEGAADPAAAGGDAAGGDAAGGDAAGGDASDAGE
jgi:hypothetical protein